MNQGNECKKENPRNRCNSKGFGGGASRIRTGDPLLAKQMRYQLRYSPIRSLIEWAQEDLNLRPHPYQGCALTS